MRGNRVGDRHGEGGLFEGVVRLLVPVFANVDEMLNLERRCRCLSKIQRGASHGNKALGQRRGFLRAKHHRDGVHRFVQRTGVGLHIGWQVKSIEGDCACEVFSFDSHQSGEAIPTRHDDRAPILIIVQHHLGQVHFHPRRGLGDFNAVGEERSAALQLVVDAQDKLSVRWGSPAQEAVRGTVVVVAAEARAFGVENVDDAVNWGAHDAASDVEFVDRTFFCRKAEVIGLLAF